MDRMRDRGITVEDLNQLRLWIASEPEVPEGQFPKTFLMKGQAAKGRAL